ncbi:hypothetical protein [Streptomyces roseochromogenus]|uniref:Uncharacterized protein n=1 Tax=Streptomyces roseochromogenus subsp. oscitans DS 12.976 TaxID=1352936 RepID=V6JW19_STRRC|nr:hypothetical protein [Streptomyces roseochromogenus]EST21089.1 hypothetical protein M878_37975 [Streptomyces roseochromogenus subsp. oscitans DS 12.976]
MERRDDTPIRSTGSPPAGTVGVAYDRDWRADVRAALRCAGALLGLLLLVDWAAGSLTWWRGALWVVLALLLLLVLFPVRVSAGAGWLAVRRLLVTRRVRTDLLTAVRPLDGVAQRLILRDALGNRVEVDPGVLIRNPNLWYLLDEGVRVSEAAGTLLCGTTALHRLARRVDSETALCVFRVSGMD